MTLSNEQVGELTIRHGQIERAIRSLQERIHRENWPTKLRNLAETLGGPGLLGDAGDIVYLDAVDAQKLAEIINQLTVLLKDRGDVKRRLRGAGVEL